MHRKGGQKAHQLAGSQGSQIGATPVGESGNVVQLHLDKMTAITFIRKIGEPDPPLCAIKAFGYTEHRG